MVCACVCVCVKDAVCMTKLSERWCVTKLLCDKAHADEEEEGGGGV